MAPASKKTTDEIEFDVGEQTSFLDDVDVESDPKTPESAKPGKRKVDEGEGRSKHKAEPDDDDDDDGVSGADDAEGDDEDEDGEGGERGGRKAREDETEEEKRERRRQERKERKRAQQRAKRQKERELEELRRQNKALEERLSKIESTGEQSKYQQLRQAASTADATIQRLEKDIADATSVGDGKKMVESQRKLHEMYGRRERIQHALSEYDESGSRRRSGGEETGDAAPAPNPKVIENAQLWMDDHPWYNPQGTDEASQIVTALDQRLEAEGYDPSKPEYWEELTRRAKRRLPEKFAEDEDDDFDDDDFDDEEADSPQKTAAPRKRRRPKVAGSGREVAGGGAKGYKLSQERIRAIKEAGAWDDPQRREAMIKRYREYDRAQANRG